MPLFIHLAFLFILMAIPKAIAQQDFSELYYLAFVCVVAQLVWEAISYSRNKWHAQREAAMNKAMHEAFIKAANSGKLNVMDASTPEEPKS